MTDAVADAAPVRRINPWVVAPVVAMAAFMEVLDIAIANVSLPHIAGDLGASLDESAWVLTSYLVTNAIFMPISGWLSTVMGRKRFFVGCIIGFSITSLLCGLAPNLGFLVLMRALQGAAGGGLQPSGQAILSDSFPPEKRGMAFALYGIAVVFAPAIGPTLGGWITDNISWRWVFLINVPVGILLFFLVSMLIEDPSYLREARAKALKEGISFDYVGFGLIALGIGALQIVLDRGQEDDWFGSSFITVLCVLSVVSLIGVAVWELRRKQPIVDLKLLRVRSFAAGTGLMFLLGFVLFGSTYLIPAFVQELLGYTATDAGLVITPGAIALMVLMAIIGRVVGQSDVRWLIGVGLIVCGVALLSMGNFDLNTDYRAVMMARVYQSLGLGFLFIPINIMAFSALPGDRTSNGSAIVNLARNLGGSVGISVGSTLLTRRTQYHTNVLGGDVQAASPALEHAHGTLTTYFHHALGVDGSQHAFAVIAQTVAAQARLLSYLDAFTFFGWIFLAALPALFFVHKCCARDGPHPMH
jgi:DHA2 family multidrug resistance protein